MTSPSQLLKPIIVKIVTYWALINWWQKKFRLTLCMVVSSKCRSTGIFACRLLWQRDDIIIIFRGRRMQLAGWNAWNADCTLSTVAVIDDDDVSVKIKYVPCYVRRTSSAADGSVYTIAYFTAVVPTCKQRLTPCPVMTRLQKPRLFRPSMRIFNSLVIVASKNKEYT